MRYSASSLELAAIMLTFAGIILNLVVLVRDEPHQVSGLSWRQRLMGRYRRQPRMFVIQWACAVVTAVLWICYLAALAA